MAAWRIRRAAPQDAAALSDLGKATFRETFTHYPEADIAAHLEGDYSPEIFASYLDSSHLWVVEADGALIGYSKLGTYKLPIAAPALPVIELHRIYVAKAWHGHKIGAALMDLALSEARAQGAKSMCLGVWSGNTNAQQFYARYGFEKIGEYDYPPIGATVDREWIMAKLL